MINKSIYVAMGRVAHDECYTTHCEAEKLAKFICENNLARLDAKIWLPFDNEQSNIYKALKSIGFENLILTNLEQGQDFYITEPPTWDMIITNPPFSGRTRLFKRLLGFGKPFIILQASQMFNNQFVVKYLCDSAHDFQFIMPRSRMNFITYNAKTDRLESHKSGAAFYSFWLCYKIALSASFNFLPDSGREKTIEQFDRHGNVIEDAHYNLFTWAKGLTGGSSYDTI